MGEYHARDVDDENGDEGFKDNGAIENPVPHSLLKQGVHARLGRQERSYLE